MCGAAPTSRWVRADGSSEFPVPRPGALISDFKLGPGESIDTTEIDKLFFFLSEPVTLSKVTKETESWKRQAIFPRSHTEHVLRGPYWDHPGVPTGLRAPGSGMATAGDPAWPQPPSCMLLLVDVGPQELSNILNPDFAGWCPLFTARPEHTPISKWHAQGSDNPDGLPGFFFFFTRYLYFQYVKKMTGTPQLEYWTNGPATGLQSWTFPCLPAFSRPFNMGVSFGKLVAGLSGISHEPPETIPITVVYAKKTPSISLDFQWNPWAF